MRGEERCIAEAGVTLPQLFPSALPFGELKSLLSTEMAPENPEFCDLDADAGLCKHRID